MYVVDASVWVSRFILSDEYHTQSRQWLEQRIRDRTPLFYPTIVLAEVAGAVARKTRRESDGLAALRVIRSLCGTRLFTTDIEAAEVAANVAAAFRLRGMDAIYIALAMRLSFPLVTWDGEQSRRVTAPIVALTPPQAPR